MPMFENQKLLKQTPRFTIILLVACLLLHTLAQFGLIDLSRFILNTHAIKANWRLGYTLFTSPFVCGSGSWKAIILHVVGLHVGTWFVIAATRGRWQLIITTFIWNYFAVCLLAHYIDPMAFQCPQLALLLSQISATYLLEDSKTYVPQIVTSILTFWYVFMQLGYPVPVFSGLCIGLVQGVLSQTTPALLGFDLFYPPQWLTTLCEKFLNKKAAVEVDKRRRQVVEQVSQDIEEQERRAEEPVDVATERQRRLDAIQRRTAMKQREQRIETQVPSSEPPQTCKKVELEQQELKEQRIGMQVPSSGPSQRCKKTELKQKEIGEIGEEDEDADSY